MNDSNTQIDEKVATAIKAATIGSILGASLALSPAEKEKADAYAEYIKTLPKKEQMKKDLNKKLVEPFKVWLLRRKEKIDDIDEE